MERVIDCTVITPERSLYSGKAEFIVAHASNGQVGFLYNHAPIISQLSIGEMRLARGNEIDRMYIEGGIIELKNNRLIVLAEKAFLASELDKDELLAKREALVSRKLDGSEESLLAFVSERDKINAKLKLLEK